MKYDYRKFSLEDRKTYKPMLDKLPYSQDLQDFFANRNRKEQRQQRSDKRHIALYGDWEKIEFALPNELSAEDSYFEYRRLIPLYRAIDKLPSIQHRRLMAHYFIGLSQREIAIYDGVCEMVVSRSLARARNTLNKLLENVSFRD